MDNPDLHDHLHDRIDNDFTYHPPTPEMVPAFEEIREEARQYAHLLVDHCPPGRELLLALGFAQQGRVAQKLGGLHKNSRGGR